MSRAKVTLYGRLFFGIGRVPSSSFLLLTFALMDS